MSIERANVVQQITAMDRRLEGSANTQKKGTPVELQTTRPDETLKQAQLTQEKVAKMVEQIQRISDMFDRKLQFRVSKELDQVIVKVIDSTTDKTVREIPSAEIQKLQIRIKETLGLLFDESI